MPSPIGGGSARVVHAEIDGPCNAAIAGVSLRETDSNDPDTAIEVEKDSQIGVAMMASAGFASHSVSLEFAGIQWEVNSQTHNGETDWAHIINVDDYATYGVGLYKVVGEATLTDGSTCSGAALVDVQGSPLGTVAGIVALASVVGGGAVIVASAMTAYAEGVRSRRRIRSWLDEQMVSVPDGGTVILGGFSDAVGKRPILPLWMIAALPALIVSGMMVGGAASEPMKAAGVHLTRLGFRPKMPVLGAIAGIFFGEGVVVLAQQYAIQPLTQSMAIFGLVLGLGVAIVIPTVVRLWETAATNRAIAAAEARINEAIEKRLASSGVTPPPGGPPADPPVPPRETMEPPTPEAPTAAPPEDEPLM